MEAESSEPLVSFYRLAPDAPRPMRADRSALGSLPTAAFQYCEAVTLASAFGWYLFSPTDFHVQWDGTDFIWTTNGGQTWSPITTNHVPGFPDVFDEKVPEDIRGYAPPLLSRVLGGLIPGVLQVWTGYMIRCRRDWSVLVRPPSNLPRSAGYEAYEGIMESDRWFFPLFTNLRITAINQPIFFEAMKPLVQIQPLRRDTYTDAGLREMVCHDSIDELSSTDWDDYRRTVVSRNRDNLPRPGRYATAVRKRTRKTD